MKVGINGFGRIGRSVFRILEDIEGIDVVAINDLFDRDALRYLLDYDTIMGPFGKSLKLEDDCFVTPKGRVKLLSERDPADLPWGELGVDAGRDGRGRAVPDAGGAGRRDGGGVRHAADNRRADRSRPSRRRPQRR